MKKLICVLLLTVMFIIPCYVNAETVDSKELYTTHRGVTTTQELYNKMIQFYSINYVETLSKEEYDNLAENIDTAIKVTYEEPNQTKGTFFATSNKSVNIVKSGQWVTLYGSWFTVPVVHSYDVIAVRFDGCSYGGNMNFKQTYGSGGNLYLVTNGVNQVFSNGIGSSALLQYGSSNEYSLTFNVSGSGTIYGTYQHATQNVTLTQSQNYTIHPGGLGRVVQFYNNLNLKYDGMTGVDISF